MKCMTAEGGVITPGITLWCDAPSTPNGKAKYTLHRQPDYWLGVSDAVPESDCVRRQGNDLILLRCSIENGMIVPETAADAARDEALVLGVLDKRPVSFSAAAPEPARYRTAIGANSCPARFIDGGLLNRDRMGKTTAHEEFRFLVVMSQGSHMDANVIFLAEDGSDLHLRAYGPQLSYSDGELRYHHPLAHAA
jgi:hypothetical protein